VHRLRFLEEDMRITQRMQTEAALFSLRENQRKVDKLRTQVATGRQVLQPEDDPQGTQRAINARSQLSTVQSLQSNVQFSQDWMEATAASLDSFGDVLNKMKLEGLRAVSETKSADERKSIAVEVREAINQAVDLANTDHSGQRLFGGFKIDANPFTLEDDLTVTYNGDGGAIRHEIEPGSQMQVNVTGEEPLFQAGFEALARLYDGLINNNTDTIRESIGGLENGADLAGQQVSMVGSRLRASDGALSRLQTFEVGLKTLIGNIENIDDAEAAVDLASAEQRYDVTLTTLARDTFKSLFDYLG
jgi:flagellar hook-associated protein 3 FlgL